MSGFWLSAGVELWLAPLISGTADWLLTRERILRCRENLLVMFYHLAQNFTVFSLGKSIVLRRPWQRLVHKLLNNGMNECTNE